jgi:hypothetical protein
MIPVSQGGPR